jgi:hypothetical protein
MTTATERSPIVIEGPDLQVNFDDIGAVAMRAPDTPEPLVAVPALVVLVAYVAIVAVLPEDKSLNNSPLEAWYTLDCTEVDVTT